MTDEELQALMGEIHEDTADLIRMHDAVNAKTAIVKAELTRRDRAAAGEVRELRPGGFRPPSGEPPLEHGPDVHGNGGDHDPSST